MASQGLEISHWVPDPIAEGAGQIFNEIARCDRPASELSVLRRLVQHPRMKQVWATLRQRHRARQEYRYTLHPLLLASNQAFVTAKRPPQDAELLELYEKLNCITLRYFFVQLLSGAVILPGVVTEHELRTGAGHFSAIADQLRAKAMGLEGFGLEPRDQGTLRAMADNYSAKAASFLSSMPSSFVVKRHRGDRYYRGFVYYLADLMIETFGHRLDGTIANITSAVLDRIDISDRDVRQILRGRQDPGPKQVLARLLLPEWRASCSQS